MEHLVGKNALMLKSINKWSSAVSAKIVTIVQVETKQVKIVKGFFKKTEEIKQEVERVWWTEAGNNSRKYTNEESRFYDWERMVINAELLQNDFKLIENK